MKPLKSLFALAAAVDQVAVIQLLPHLLGPVNFE